MLLPGSLAEGVDGKYNELEIELNNDANVEA